VEQSKSAPPPRSTFGFAMYVIPRVAAFCTAVALSVVAIPACSDGLPASSAVDADFRAALNPGDSSEKIEAFFKSRHFGV